MDYQLDLHGQELMEQYHERQADYQRLAQVADGAATVAIVRLPPVHGHIEGWLISSCLTWTAIVGRL